MRATRTRIAVLALVAAASVALSGCVQSTPTPTSSATTLAPLPTSTESPTETPTSSPSPSPTETAAVTLPTDCATLGTEQTRTETVGDMTLQSNGEGFVRPAPAGATLALGCDWIVGEASGVLLLISTAAAPEVTDGIEGLPAQGYDCQPSDDFGAQFCVLPGAGADTEEIIVARDTVWIYFSTVNRNGRAFLSDIAQGIFG